MVIISTNKKANFDYFLSEKTEAGIVLVGSEVKSVRQGGVSLVDSFVLIENGEAFLKNVYIKPYEKAAAFLPKERRDRKLLLHKSEIIKLARHKEREGASIIPTKIYIENGKVKVEIALAIGKKNYDKRDTLRERSMQREIDLHLKKIN